MYTRTPGSVHHQSEEPRRQEQIFNPNSSEGTRDALRSQVDHCPSMCYLRITGAPCHYYQDALHWPYALKMYVPTPHVKNLTQGGMRRREWFSERALKALNISITTNTVKLSVLACRATPDQQKLQTAVVTQKLPASRGQIQAFTSKRNTGCVLAGQHE